MSLFDKDIIEKEIPFSVIFKNKIIDIINDGLTQLSSAPKLLTSEKYLEYYVRKNIYNYIHETGTIGRNIDWVFTEQDYVYVHVFNDFSMISVAVKKEVCMKLNKDLEFTLYLCVK